MRPSRRIVARVSGLRLEGYATHAGCEDAEDRWEPHWEECDVVDAGALLDRYMDHHSEPEDDWTTWTVGGATFRWQDGTLTATIAGPIPEWALIEAGQDRPEYVDAD